MTLAATPLSAAPLSTATPAGFDDPVGDAQRVFRRVLQAMSRPGRVVECGASPAAPAPFGAAAASLLLTLADYEAPVWLDAASRTEAAVAFLRFHTGCAVPDDTRDAGFVFIAEPGAMPSLASLPLGSDEAPETGCTLIIEVAEIDPHAGFAITGPGIDGAARFRVGGLDDRFWIARSELQRIFPRGIDVIFTCGARLAALPRTTRLEL